MEQRVSLITLGVADVAASRDFYERLGWRCAMFVEDTAFFQAGGLIVTLWGREKLAEDMAVADPGGWSGIGLAHNVRSPEEVNAVVAEARSAGATITKEPATTFYGGYAGAFADPDGHTWEIAYNPGFPLAPDGTISLPE